MTSGSTDSNRLDDFLLCATERAIAFFATEIARRGNDSGDAVGLGASSKLEFLGKTIVAICPADLSHQKTHPLRDRHARGFRNAMRFKLHRWCCTNRAIRITKGARAAGAIRCTSRSRRSRRRGRVRSLRVRQPKTIADGGRRVRINLAAWPFARRYRPLAGDLAAASRWRRQ